MKNKKFTVLATAFLGAVLGLQAQLPLHWKQVLAQAPYNSQVCTDASGNTYIIVQSYSSETVDFGNGISGVSESTNGGTSTPESTENRGGGSFKSYLAKYNTAGVCQWMVPFSPVGSVGLTSLAVNELSEVMVVGEVYGSVDLNPSTATDTISDGGFMAKYNSSGSLVFYHKVKQTTEFYKVVSNENTPSFYFTGRIDETDDLAYGVPQTLLGDTVARSFFLKYTGSSVDWAFQENLMGFWDLELDPIANNLAYTGGLYTSVYNLGNDAVGSLPISANNGDNVIFCMATTDGAASFLAKVADPTSNFEFISLAVKDNGDIYATGFINGSATIDFLNGITLTAPSANQQTLLVKYNGNSDFCEWAAFNGTTYSPATLPQIELDRTQSVLYNYFTFTGTADIDYDGSTTHNVTSAGGADIAIVKLDADGNYLDAITLGGSSSEYLREMVINPMNNLVVTGYAYDGTGFDFDPGSGTVGYDFSTTSFGASFVAEYGPNFVGTEEINSADVVIYPNPATDILNIQLPTTEPLEYAIYNMLGCVVKTGTTQQQILISELTTGAYVLIVKDQHNLYKKSFFKR